jgi:hypothetical protein
VSKVTILLAAVPAQCGRSATTVMVRGRLRDELPYVGGSVMNEKLEAAKQFLGNRYVLSKGYKPLKRHNPTNPVNTLETIREARARIQQGAL